LTGWPFEKKLRAPAGITTQPRDPVKESTMASPATDRFENLQLPTSIQLSGPTVAGDETELT
jgi:hypothetical protein